MYVWLSTYVCVWRKVYIFSNWKYEVGYDGEYIHIPVLSWIVVTSKQQHAYSYSIAWPQQVFNHFCFSILKHWGCSASGFEKRLEPLSSNLLLVTSYWVFICVCADRWIIHTKPPSPNIWLLPFGCFLCCAVCSAYVIYLLGPLWAH